MSRAIRASAKEAFIRILSLDILDSLLPAEIERLESLKVTQQSRYRFNVHRRTMLLQAIGSTQSLNADDSAETTHKLVSQLSETVVACDRLTEELVKITDQLSQLKKLADIHWASALAIALRKVSGYCVYSQRSTDSQQLNGSYGRRTADLISARERVAHLEAELEDAWKSAETMAMEIDDLHAEQENQSDTEELDDGTAIIGTAEIVTISPPMSPVARNTFNLQSGPPTPTFGYFALEKSSPPAASIPKEVDASDAASIQTTRSRRSHHSTRSIGTSRASMVSAAKRRSVRTSLGSLRLPPRNATREEIPPVPDVPHSHSYPPTPQVTSQKIRYERPSFLHLSTSTSIGNLQEANKLFPQQTQRTQIEDLDIDARLSPEEPKRAISTMDDLHIMPLTILQEDSIIEEVPRFPHRRSMDENTLAGATKRMDGRTTGEGHSTTTTIPSIWLHADAPSTPAERLEDMMRGPETTKTASLQKLKSFTKRYSSPFPNIARSLSSLRTSRTH